MRIFKVRTGSHKKKFIVDIDEEDADIAVERPASIEDPKVYVFFGNMVFSVKSSLELMLYCFIMCRIKIKFSYLILLCLYSSHI
jgi:hypothetical protein